MLIKLISGISHHVSPTSSNRRINAIKQSQHTRGNARSSNLSFSRNYALRNKIINYAASFFFHRYARSHLSLYMLLFDQWAMEWKTPRIYRSWPQSLYSYQFTNIQKKRKRKISLERRGSLSLSHFGLQALISTYATIALRARYVSRGTGKMFKFCVLCRV